MSQSNGAANSPTSIHVAYLGPEASFSHQAALAVFPPSPNSSTTLHPLPSFTSIFGSLQSSSSSLSSSPSSKTSHDSPPPPPAEETTKYTYGLVPVENSTNGSVVQVLDLFSQCSDEQYPDIEVCGEYYLSVHHCLFTHSSSSINPSGTKDDYYGGIKIVYTHPQVWGQVGRFLGSKFPLSPSAVEKIDVSSTSSAAKLVGQDNSGGSAAICSSLAGELYGLKLLEENIEDEPGRNTTRFFVLRNRTRRRGGADEPGQNPVNGTGRGKNWKSLITFTIPHAQPGSLADALAVFKTHGFNLTSIDSRPSRRRNWHYVFLVECEKARDGNVGEEEYVGDLMEELKEHTEVVRYMGSWIDQLQKVETDGIDTKS